MKKHVLIGVVVLAVMALSVGVAAASEARTVFRTFLQGPNSDAHGKSVVVFNGDNSELSFKLVVNGLENPTMAHIHVAPAPGADGPPVLWLYPDGPPPQEIPGVFNGMLGKGTATSADLTGAAGISTLEELRSAIEEGRAYINVHTTANPGGEIRGTLE